MREPTKADEPTGFVEGGPTRTTDNTGQCINTDRHLWPLVSDDYYADRLHVTADGQGIGINCGGHVIVKTLRAWHELDARNRFLADALTKIVEDMKSAMRKSTAEIVEMQNRRMLGMPDQK